MRKHESSDAERCCPVSITRSRSSQYCEPLQLPEFRAASAASAPSSSLLSPAAVPQTTNERHSGGVRASMTMLVMPKKVIKAARLRA